MIAGNRRLRRGAAPASWWGGVRAATNSLLRGDPDLIARVAAISLSGRGGGMVLCDAGGRALLPPGLASVSPAVALTFGGLEGQAARMRPLAGHVMQALAEQPRLATRLRGVLAAKDWLGLKLTGAAVTDPASGPDRSGWPIAVLNAVDFPVAALPAVRLPWPRLGALTASAGDALGLLAGLPVVTGAHDGVAAQIGAGMVAPGDAALTLGTHAVFRVISAASIPEAAPFRFYNLWGERDSRQVYGGNARCGGASAGRFARLAGGESEAACARLERDAAAVPAGSARALFLPLRGGMHYPERQPHVRGSFSGLSAEHGRGHLYRAVLEGTVFALRHIVECLAECGVSAQTIRLTGGGARSALWRQILADTLGRPLGVSASPGFEECIGVAHCAWVMFGVCSNIEAAIAAGAPAAAEVQPGTRARVALKQQYARSRRALANTIVSSRATQRRRRSSGRFLIAAQATSGRSGTAARPQRTRQRRPRVSPRPRLVPPAGRYATGLYSECGQRE